MIDANQNQEALKQAVKEALTEVLREDRQLFQDILTEVIEGVGLAQAIREGRAAEQASGEEVAEAVSVEQLKELLRATQDLPQIKRLSDEEIADEVAAYRSTR